MREKYFGKSDDDGFEVWPANWRALQFFLLLATQWTVDAMGQMIGLRYEAVESIFSLYRIPPRQRARLFEDVRLIESGAIQAAREKANTNG